MDEESNHHIFDCSFTTSQSQHLLFLLIKGKKGKEETLDLQEINNINQSRERDDGLRGVEGLQEKNHGKIGNDELFKSIIELGIALWHQGAGKDKRDGDRVTGCKEGQRDGDRVAGYRGGKMEMRFILTPVRQPRFCIGEMELKKLDSDTRFCGSIDDGFQSESIEWGSDDGDGDAF
ncbi:hypothetical protein NE237_018236 [Protea cynaroides]|uniref:Uncharacterized protein n=1 Tax=Protea cynaroides TaxID=273540 RepID=A0A9Q0QNT2_9MAGN|nr:hypothetical protein NE237_018236 [Protea cynaroides]